MPYRMSKLSFGSSVLDPIFDINTDLEITGLCHVDKFGFLFLFRDHHCMGYSDYKGKITLPWMGVIDQKGDKEGTCPLFDHPSSICYWPHLKTCYLLEAGGSKLKSIEMGSKYCGKINLQDSYKRYFSKIDNVELMETACDVNAYGDLYWVVKNLHRCFKKKMENNMVENYIGNGHAGFSISNNLSVCLLSSPSGIKCLNNMIYISDSGNRCIREVNGGIIRLVMGNPLNEKILSFPSKIVINNSIIYVLDKYDIKYLSLNDKNNGLILSFQNIVAIESGARKDIYVLERA